MSSPENTQFWCVKYSPNGRWIHFTWLRLSEQGAELELHVAPAEGAPPDACVRIAPDHDWPDKPKWASDGKALFFVSKGSGSYQNLWATRFDPERGRPVGQPFALTQFDSPTMLISPYIETSDLSISARHAALTMLTVTGSIWMLENLDR
jgi:hypothetical protein